jgi:hypothetical protein
MLAIAPKKCAKICRPVYSKLIIPCIILLMFCSPVGLTPNQSDLTSGGAINNNSVYWFEPSEGSQEYSSTGASQPVTFGGLFSNATQPIVMLDSSAPTAVSIAAPQGWSTNDLSGTIEHISTKVGGLTNGLLDDYHSERCIITGSAWSSETYYIPDGWSLLKSGDSTIHPGHGGLYWYTSAGSGMEDSMGWRPSVLFDTGKTIDPSMEIYLSQQVQLPWREVYSCEMSFYHRVPSGQTLSGIFYLFVRVGSYEAKFNVLSAGYTTDTWIQTTVDVPASVFSNIPVPGSVPVSIGLGTDFSGQPSSNINNYVYIDEINAVFKARPFPEQIGLSVNQSIITSSVSGNISPYVPDGVYRDCSDNPTTGIVSSPMDVGVKGTAWSDASKYQTAFQFQLDIPSGAVITSARLEIEAQSSVGGGNNGLRVYVAQQDDFTPFSAGLPHLEERYDWSATSVNWLLTSWAASSRYMSPDISSLVQGVVSRNGWSSGNYISIMLDYMFSDSYNDYNRIKGTSSYNGEDLARLFVDFMIPLPEDTISLFKYKKDIVVDHTKVSSGLQDFPVLVDIFDSDLKANAQEDGDDIRFWVDNELLDYQIELYDSNYNLTHAHLIAWVRVPFLSSSIDTTISMRYGNPDISRMESPLGVWQDRYQSIWHMSESSGSGAYLKDSSSFGHDGTPTGATFMDNGKIDGARYLQNSGYSYILFDGGEDIANGWSDWQFSFWMYPDFSSSAEWLAGSSEPDVFYKGASMTLARVYTYGGSDGTLQIDTHFQSSGTSYLTVGIRNQVWNYIVLKYESSGDGRLRAYSYVNGGLFDTYNELVGTGDRLVNDASSFLLGSTSPGYSFCGEMDEFRSIKEGYTSLAWIQTEYANQYDPTSFSIVSEEQTTQVEHATTLLFSTTNPSIVEILPRLNLNVTSDGLTLDTNFQEGTSFSVSNDTDVRWTASVLVSPPTGISDLCFNLSNPAVWTLTNVIDSVGHDRLSDITSTSTQVLVSSSALDVYGIWTFTFSSTNEATNLECGTNAGSYGTTVELKIGDSAKFRGTATVIPGSAMRLSLIDPSGQLFYSANDLAQDGSGQFEWTGISVTNAWPNGLWEVHVDFNNTADSSPERVGRYSRLFTIKHASSLSLLSPTDAVGDGVAVRTAGELLEVEVQLTNTETSQDVAGSEVTMNWSISGADTQVQLEDYGNGIYGKTLNTSELNQAGNWRINIVSSHPYLIDAATFFDLELSRNTILTYKTPPSTPYGDDFSVIVMLQDAITGAGYNGASFTSNGTINGVTDYNNGTYRVRLDSAGLSFGAHCYTINAIPVQSFVIGNSVDVVFRYREMKTDLVQIEINPVSVPWGQNATVTLKWRDIDHAFVGISGGSLLGDGVFQYSDLLDGRYSLQIEVDSYSIGVYLFNFTIDGTNYQTAHITVAVTVRPHRTIVMATYDGTVSMGSNVTVTLDLLDHDAGDAVITGNLSSVLAEWTGGSAGFGSLQILIECQDWVIGTYTIDITVFASISPRYFYDGTTSILLRIHKLAVSLSWDDIDIFPIGDDFEITTHVTVNDSSSIYDDTPVISLLQSHFVIRDKNGTLYTIKTFSAQPAGTYVLTLDQAYFPEGAYGIRVFLVFGMSENYSNTQTPIISFQYAQARSDLSSPDYPLLTISYSTNAVVTLEFIDIDRGIGIDTATIFVTGANILGQQLISSGRYRVTLNTSSWDIGTYSVTLKASAVTYENKTVSINIQIRQIRTFATATVGALEIPVGDSRTFYVDYFDMDHNLPIFTLNHNCSWTPAHFDIVWTANRYSITIHTFDSDALTSYVLVFDFGAGSEYQAATFNVTVVIRTITTELRLLSPVEDTTSDKTINVSVYYGDRDHLQGIAASDVLCTVWNTTHQLLVNWGNDSIRGNGCYIISIPASQFGGIGIQQLTIYFNWTGSIQKYENRFLSVEVEILGADTELTLIEAALPSPCLDYMVYTFLYSSPSTGGITNDSSNVFINVEFVGTFVDLSQVDIWEIDSVNNKGEYSIGFNNSILGGTGLFSMRIFINWSAGVVPFYTNRTDLISVRVLPRTASLSVIPPTNVPFGENATFSFTYEDTTGGLSSPIAYSPTVMTVSLNVPDFTLNYNSLENLYTVSFDTSQLGAPLGARTLVLSLAWSGLPFYSNVTGRTIAITLVERQTILTYPTPPATPYGNNVSFTVSYIDVVGSTSKAVLNTTIEVYVGVDLIPSGYIQITDLGSGEYRVDLNTSYFSQPGLFSLRVEAASEQFYYQSRSGTKSLAVNPRLTLLTAEPVASVPYDSSFSIVLHYQDLDTLLPIGNDTGVMVYLEILNGTDWIFTCSWRPSHQNYLLTVETSNQPLELGHTYNLWLNFSSEFAAPFYEWNDILVPFEMKERKTSLDLISSPSQTHYQDYANFTILYKDVSTALGISGGTIYLHFGMILLQPSVEYDISEIGPGRYLISVDTSVLGPPGVKTIHVTANWSAGSPYYDDALRNINIPVTERPSNVEIVFPPGQTWYLDNVTFDFAFVDLSTGEGITVSLSDIKVFSGTVLLASGEYIIEPTGSIFELQINSTVIAPTLVSNWNITIQIDWTSGAPYYRDDVASIFVNTVGRSANVELSQIQETPIGDLMSINLIYTDARTQNGIEGATIVLSCVEEPGLVEGVDYWVQMGTGIDSGKYEVLVSTSSLGNLGVFTFSIEVQWSAFMTPFYGTVLTSEIQGRVREIQTSVSSGLPSPSVVAFYEDVSFVIQFDDTDHDVPINGAEGQITVRYKSTGLEPSSWTVQPISDGQYNITITMMDPISSGLKTVLVTIAMSQYQLAQTSIVLGLRDRVAGISAVVAPANYAGYATAVMVYLVDYDANDNPLAGATLTLTWGDSKSYIDLGDGSYNLTLQTANLNYGSQILTVHANLLHYSINSLNVEINLLAVPSNLIITWTGPRSSNEVYWGEPLTIFASMNDTLRNQTVSLATMTFNWPGGNGSFLPSGILGNYTAILDTSLGSVSDTIIVRIEGSAPNYIDASEQIVFRLLPRPMAVIPEGNQYVFTVSFGDTREVVVYLEDSLDSSLVTEADLVAWWDYESNLTITEISSKPGYYRFLISAGTVGFGSYQIHLNAGKQNYADVSITLIMAISKIQMVVLLDNATAAYDYTPVYWSEMVRIGVYVLAPALNVSYPFSTGINDLLVTWNSPELSANGTFVNGVSIGGPGYYYYDLNTSLGIAALYTFYISVDPPSPDYERADNSTSIFVRNLEATVISPGTDEFVWGWTGLVNVTYYDSYHAQGVQAESSVFSWAGGFGSAFYLGEGIYGIPINTTGLRPGTYTISIEFQKANYDAAEITIRIHIAPVPTSIEVLLPEFYQSGDSWEQLRVPYGDILTITLLYNDIYGATGIPDAIFDGSFYSGRDIFEEQLVLLDQGYGNYTFIFSTLNWTLGDEIAFHIQFALENRTTAVFDFGIKVIEIQTSLDVMGPAVISLHWGMNTTFSIYYSDAWPGHPTEGITEAIITIENDGPQFATVDYLGPDESHQGYYLFRVTASSITGVAEVTIHFNKTYYASDYETISISVSPSSEQILMRTAMTLGSAFIIFVILFAVVWVRILRVPKIIRIISGQVRQLRKNKVPKPAKSMRSRQAIVAELFNELNEPIGVKRKASQLPAESITIEVPEIDELIIDLAILTGMTQQELNDFKFEISKMKMSQQTSFVREVIGQEAIRVAGVQNKSVEQVMDEVVEERRKRIGGAATVAKPDLYEDLEEETEVSEEEDTGLDFEHRLREIELAEMAEQLEKRGIPSHEIESFITQARDLPKDVVELLLQGFTPRKKPEVEEGEVEHLSEKELEDLRSELIKRKASEREIDSIMEQARELPRKLALEFFKEPETTTKRKPRKKIDTLSEQEREDLRAELVRKKVPKQEIDTIVEEAKTAPRENIQAFLESIEDTELEVPIKEVEFEDRLSDLEIENLREQLEQRGLPQEEIASILKQAKNLPSALIDELLRSIDADLDAKK